MSKIDVETWIIYLSKIPFSFRLELRINSIKKSIMIKKKKTGKSTSLVCSGELFTVLKENIRI